MEHVIATTIRVRLNQRGTELCARSAPMVLRFLQLSTTIGTTRKDDHQASWTTVNFEEGRLTLMHSFQHTSIPFEDLLDCLIGTDIGGVQQKRIFRRF